MKVEGLTAKRWKELLEKSIEKQDFGQEKEKIILALSRQLSRDIVEAKKTLELLSLYEECKLTEEEAGRINVLREEQEVSSSTCGAPCLARALLWSRGRARVLEHPSEPGSWACHAFSWNPWARWLDRLSR